MKRVAIVQARMTSTRLPGKVLASLSGQPMLVQQLDRLRRARSLDAIVIATTRNAADDPIVELAERAGVGCFRGDEHDVLGRYVGSARACDAEVVVRVTADCPLIDARVVDRVVDRLCAGTSTPPVDYVSNTIRRTYPRGLDVEAFFRDVLERMNRLARSAPAREHVTYFLHREQPSLFLTDQIVDEQDHSDLRWTVDTPEDFAFVAAVYEGLGLPSRDASYADIVRFVRAHPEIVAINAGVEQKKV